MAEYRAETDGMDSTGVVLSVDTEADSSGESYTAIAELLDVGAPQMSKTIIDMTHAGVTNKYRIFKSGYKDPGQVTVRCNFTREGHEVMKTEFDRSTPNMWRVTFPDTGNTTVDFEALVQDLGVPSVEDDRYIMEVTLKVSGEPVWAS